MLTPLLPAGCGWHADPPQPGGRSPITTHVLDTCLGRPAPGVHISLRRQAPGSSGAWELVAASQTNQDGRIGGKRWGAEATACHTQWQS